MRRLLLGITAIVIPLILVLAVAEVALRIQPSLIGVALLDRFPTNLKSEIASRLGLPTGADFRLVPSAERFDKGPDLFLPKPNSQSMLPPEVADAALGAIDRRESDERGFCNPPGKLSGGSADLVVIGGSVPSCVGVDANGLFATLLGPTSGLRTYDMTVGGVGPYEYVEVLRRFGMALKPRIVVMAFSEANDLRDCKRYEDHLAGKKYTHRLKREWSWPFNMSYALSFLKSGGEFAVRTVKRGLGEDFTYTVEVLGKRRPMNIRNGDKDELEAAKAFAQGLLSVSICEPALSAFAQLGKENGFLPVVMATPAAHTVYRRSVLFKNPEFGPLLGTFDDSQRDWLAKNAARIGYRYIDIVEELQIRAASSPLLYFPSNAHLTVDGHKLLAEIIGPKLKQILENP